METAGYIVGRASDHELAATIGIDPATALDPVSSLSTREREVYDLLCEGFQNREIAKRLFISVETVKDHVAAVLRALGVNSRTQAVLAVSQMSSQGQVAPWLTRPLH